MTPRWDGFQDPLAWVNALKRLDRVEEALPALRLAVYQQPDQVILWVALSQCLYGMCNSREAVEAMDRAIAVATSEQSIQLRAFYRSPACLANGQIRESLEDFEERWRDPFYTKTERAEAFTRLTGVPRWDGSPLRGRSLLLHGELGFGDIIQMARFIPRLRDFGAGRIVLEVHEPLVRLLQACGADEVLASPTAGDGRGFDVVASVLSLRHLAGPAIPPSTLLWADPGRASMTDRFMCGLAWAPARPDEIYSAGPASRSIPVACLRPLFATRDVSFANLQIGPRASELPTHCDGQEIPRITEGVRDFADTAAALTQIGAVVTGDFVTTHLAGAMGIPTLLLLCASCDPRWGWSGDSSEWYPSVRIIRQRSPGDWISVVLEARHVLQTWAQEHRLERARSRRKLYVSNARSDMAV